MILCCMCSLDPWFACPLFRCFVLWLLRSFVWSFCFSCPSLFCLFPVFGCMHFLCVRVCVCCHFLSSAGVWATESKGDHSGSARQLDSGSRCGVLLTSSPPEPSFVTTFLSFFPWENSSRWLKLGAILNSSNIFSISQRAKYPLRREKTSSRVLKFRWGIFQMLEMRRYVNFLALLKWVERLDVFL